MYIVLLHSIMYKILFIIIFLMKRMFSVELGLHFSINFVFEETVVSIPFKKTLMPIFV